MEGDFSRENRSVNKKLENIGGIYWGLVVAIFLGYSLLTNNWHISWIIFAVGGVLYAVVVNIAKMILMKK